MKNKVPIYSKSTKTALLALSQIISPKIRYHEDHELLKKPRNQTYMTERIESHNLYKKSIRNSLMDITEKEICDTKSELNKQVETSKSSSDDVKHLDNWIYEKGLYKKHDTDYQMKLRSSISKKVREMRLDSSMNKQNNCIIKAVSYQLKREEIFGSKKSIPMVSSKINISEQYKQIKEKTERDLKNLLNEEITNELQSLTLQEKYGSKKRKTQNLMVENNEIINKLKSLRIVML